MQGGVFAVASNAEPWQFLPMKTKSKATKDRSEQIKRAFARAIRIHGRQFINFNTRMEVA